MSSESEAPRTISELLAKHGGSIKTGPFGTALKASEYANEGVPLISVREIGHGTFHIDGKTPRVGTATLARLPEYILAEGDIVFARKGGIERCALIRKQQIGWFLGSDGIRLRPPKSCDARYLSYSLQTAAVKEWLLQNSTGSTMASLNQATIGRLPIELPSLAEQHVVADTLELLDDRITLLRETNATLEAIAQALFKSWFVDFDPVRARMEGRAPEGMDEATAALFPDGFEDSALGLVPKGWRVLTLDEALEINPKRTLKKASLAPYLDMASLGTSGHCVDEPIQREMGSGAKFRNGDTLLARITPCLENGKAAFVDFLADGQVGWGSTEFVVLRPKAPLPEYFGYLLCRHPAFREHAIQSMSGTSGRQRIQNDVLGRYLLAVPGPEIASVFAGVVVTIQQSIAANHKTAQTLATLRDTLLPRLISGQLRLNEVEHAS